MRYLLIIPLTVAAYILLGFMIGQAEAETLNHAVEKAQIKWHMKESKKAVRERIKAKYKPEIEAVKEKMKNEIETELEKCGTNGCPGIEVK